MAVGGSNVAEDEVEFVVRSVEAEVPESSEGPKDWFRGEKPENKPNNEETTSEKKQSQ